MKFMRLISIQIVSVLALSIVSCSSNDQQSKEQLKDSVQVETEKSLDKTESKSKQENDDEKEGFTSWTGTYYDELGRALKIKGPSSDGVIRFEISQLASESCEESGMKGVAYLTKPSVANYTDDDSDCHINFTFNTGRIELKEYDCLHGGACAPFEGVYVSKK